MKAPGWLEPCSSLRIRCDARGQRCLWGRFVADGALVLTSLDGGREVARLAWVELRAEANLWLADLRTRASRPPDGR